MEITQFIKILNYHSISFGQKKKEPQQQKYDKNNSNSAVYPEK